MKTLLFIFLIISISLSNVININAPKYEQRDNQPDRFLFSPAYDSIAYNNYLNYMGTYGGNPWSFTPYASLHTNPFSNPKFAQNFPREVSKFPYGRQMMNYMQFMNPLLYIPTGYGNPWNMGKYGIGSGVSKKQSFKNRNSEIYSMMGLPSG